MSVSTELSPVNSAPAEVEAERRVDLGAALLRAGSLVAFAGLFALFAATAPFFFTAGNLGNVLGQAAILGVLAVGLTAVLAAGGANVVSGGIDLSLAANMGLSAAVYAVLVKFGQGDAVAMPAALATGLAIGAVNAVAVTLLRVVPLLATLAVMNIVAGLELVLTQNTVVPASTPVLSALSGYGPFMMPVLAYVLVVFVVAATAVLQFTPVGLRLYAVGEFREAARAAGLPVRRLVAGSYLASGFCGGFAGILSVANLSGSTTGSGEMLLSVVVTALLGVVFSRRLLPTVPGTFLSTLFVGMLVNGFQLLNLSSTLVNGVQGVLIIVVVAATTLLRESAE